MKSGRRGENAASPSWREEDISGLLDHVVAERFLDVVDKDLLGAGSIRFLAQQGFRGARHAFGNRLAVTTMPPRAPQAT